MRTFIQSVAGGTFIKGEYMTFVVRKDHAEYIFKLRNSLYGIINFLINGEDEVILLADWGFFFRRVTNHADSEQLMRMLEKHCPKVVKLFSDEFDNSDYSVVTLTSGQTLVGDIGCEVMLRVGSAVCVAPSSPGLIDETTAGTLNNGGALVQNHLYMMTIEGRGVQATAATTKLLVRGSYTVA